MAARMASATATTFPVEGEDASGCGAERLLGGGGFFEGSNGCECEGPTKKPPWAFIMVGMFGARCGIGFAMGAPEGLG